MRFHLSVISQRRRHHLKVSFDSVSVCSRENPKVLKSKSFFFFLRGASSVHDPKVQFQIAARWRRLSYGTDVCVRVCVCAVKAARLVSLWQPFVVPPAHWRVYLDEALTAHS